MAVTIYQLGPGGYWTGAFDEIGEADGCPQGWTRAALPQMGDGDFAVFDAPEWMVTDQPFAPAPVIDPVPLSVTRRQAKLALLNSEQIGLAPNLLVTAEAIIAAADDATKIEWADALEFRRDHPLILAIGEPLGITSEEVDALFRFAATFA